MGLGGQQYPLSWPGNRHNNFLSGHVIEHLFDLFLVLCGYLALGMLNWDYGRVGPDDVGTGHIIKGVKRVGESSLQCHYVPDLGWETRGSCHG